MEAVLEIKGKRVLRAVIPRDGHIASSIGQRPQLQGILEMIQEYGGGS